MYCFHSLFYFTHTKLKWPWARDAREVRHMVWEHVPLRTPTLPGGSWAKTLACGQPVGDLSLLGWGWGGGVHNSLASCQGRCCHLQALAGMETKAARNSLLP